MFWETPEETAVVEQLQEDVAALVQTGQDVPPARLIALAAYRPLHQFLWAEHLLDCDWPFHLEDVIAQQIREPIEERSLRNEVRVLTPIQDSVSLSVRAQYEENPYPRWIKTSGCGKARPIGAALRGSPLDLDLGDYESPVSPEVLIAGCGTILVGLMFLLTGINWIIDPSSAAEGLGMELLTGVGASTQIGDIGSFFFSIAVMIGLAQRPGRARWFYPAANPAPTPA